MQLCTSGSLNSSEKMSTYQMFRRIFPVILCFVFVLALTIKLPKFWHYNTIKVNKSVTLFIYNTSSTSSSPLIKVPFNRSNTSEPEITFVGSGFIYFQTIPECQCSRRVVYPPPQISIISKLNSSCSDEGTFYQENQNVISTSLYFKFDEKFSQLPIHSIVNYQPGLLQNLAMMRQHFPGYTFRIYTNIALKLNSSWCQLLCKNEDLFWCDIRRTPSHGNLVSMNFRTWRFLVLGDPTVKIFLSRDLDSLLSYREAAAVQDWLENVGNKPFQSLRDSTWHDKAMLAGMWGAQNNRLLENSRGAKLREKIIQFSQRKEGYWVDQMNLERFIFSDTNVVAYDSYHCSKWANKSMVRPFPVQRKGHPEWDFVGNIVNFRRMDAVAENEIIKGKKGPSCPVECRPAYGKDWIYC